MTSRAMLPVGSRYCKCSACGELFGGETAFDVHRTGTMDDRRCMVSLEMIDHGLSRDDRGYWRREFGSRS